MRRFIRTLTSKRLLLSKRLHFAEWPAFGVLIALIIQPAVLGAQYIALQAGSIANGRLQVAPNAKLVVPVVVDMTTAAGQSLASLSAAFTWGSARLTLDSIRAAGFGSLTSNTTGATSGTSVVSLFDAAGTQSSATLATLYYTAGAATGGTTIAITPTIAGSATGSAITSLVRVRDLDVCVAPATLWGDANGDQTVNIIDAQQIARFSVALSIASPTALASLGDVNADGAVNIIDAQQVARFTVGLSAAVRVNTSTFTAPALASLSISSVLDAAANAVNPGVPVNLAALANGRQARVIPLARDAANANVTACTTITYSSSNPAVAAASADGFITAVGSGTASITVSAGGLSASVNIVVPASIPASLSVTLANAALSGNNSTVASAVVRDASGAIVNGASITWTSSAPLVARVDANGNVQALGGGTATITASSGALSASKTLTASAAPATFNISVRYIGSVSVSRQAVFQAAVARWTAMIRTGGPNYPMHNVDESGCAEAGVVLNETVNGVIIYVNIGPIDGVGAVLGSAGPCDLRSGSPGLPVTGVVNIDEADLELMEADGRFPSVVVHEIGHVLGFGTLWTNLGLLDTSVADDPIFTGTFARHAFANIGFASYSGRVVPLENVGGSGTVNAHWRETVLDREVMTGYVERDGSVMPLSALTIGSMLDLGYVVDFAQAETAALSLLLRGSRPLRVPIVEGRPPVTRVIDPRTGRPM